MSLALGALAGILSGLQGLPKGMAEGTQADQRQQQIDELQRSRMATEANQTTDLGQLSQMLGITLPGVQAGVKVPTSTANVVAQKGLADQAKQQERAQMDALRAQVPEHLRPYFGVPGGADLYKAGQPQRPKIEMRAGAGDTFAITTDRDTGEPSGTPRPLGIGAPESRALVTPGHIERRLRHEGLTPGTEKWDSQYLRYAQPSVVVPEVGAFPKLDAMGGGASQTPQPTSVPSASPNGNALRAQAAETTTPSLKAALLEAATAADRAGGAGVAPPHGPRTAGAPGGPQPSLAFPKKPLSPDDAGALGVPYGTKKEEAYGKTPLLAGQRTKMDAQASVLAMIDNMEGDLKGISQPKSPMDRLVGIPKAVMGVKGQTDPKLAAFHSRIESTLALVVRALGEVGTLTDGDIQRARNLQPTVYPIPDTEDVVREKMQGLRRLVQEVAARTGSRPENMGQPGPAPSGGAVKWGRDPKTGNPVRLQ